MNFKAIKFPNFILNNLKMVPFELSSFRKLKLMDRSISVLEVKGKVKILHNDIVFSTKLFGKQNI
jgi:hypothetical protein